MADVQTPQQISAAQQSTADKSVDALIAGKGEAALDVSTTSSNASALSLQGGYRFNTNWAAYGDAWWQPSQGEVGGSVGVIWKSLNISASGWDTPSTGEVGGQVGIGVSF